MKTDLFFKDINDKNDVVLLNNVDDFVKEKFENKYSKYKDTFFYEQFKKCGGIVVDYWIRLYGCGELNVFEKNERYNNSNTMDILIGEDILGGLFGLKNEYVYYFAPDTNEWENMKLYYTQFIDWILNKPDSLNKFYELYRWNNWKEDCKKLKLTEGFHFYPLLQSNCDIEKRNRKIISIDELIMFSINFRKKFN